MREGGVGNCCRLANGQTPLFLPRLVSPLMQEYDVILHQLQREADDYKVSTQTQLVKQNSGILHSQHKH